MNYAIMLPLAKRFEYLGIDIEMLSAEVSVATNMFKLNKNVSCPSDVLLHLESMRSAFPNLLLFTNVILTIPVSSANAERSFSTLKRVKTYLRSTMLEPRLNNLCILAIERDYSEELFRNPVEIVDEFAAKPNRTLSFLPKRDY